jgi:hypothetical protein
VRAYVVGLVGAAVALSIGTPVMRASRTGGERAQGPRCTPIIQSIRPLTLPDGSFISIDAKSAATDGASIMLAGPSVLAWSPQPERNGLSIHPTGAVGVLRNAAGQTTLVPAPTSSRQFAAVRVASAGNGLWHFLLLAGARPDTLIRISPRLDSISIWYGLFDGRKWRRLAKITVAHNGRLAPEEISDLIETPHGLAFAYAFARPQPLNSSVGAVQGLVLFTGNGDKWKADTLPTWDEPTAVQITQDVSGRILAVFSQMYLYQRRPRGPVLFAALHDSVWQDPHVAWQPAAGYVSSPLTITDVGDDGRASQTLLSWTTGRVRPDVDSLTWGVLSDDGTVRQIGPPVGTNTLRGVAVARIPGRGAVWATRNGAVRDGLRVVYARDTMVADLGTVTVPFDNVNPVGGTLADGRILIATMRVRYENEAPQSATTYVTELDVRCRSASYQ